MRNEDLFMCYAIFIDIESNGLDPAVHRCLEIAFRLVDVQSGEEKLSYSALVKQDTAVWARSDLVSLSINGFTWEQVQQGKSEQEVSQEIIAALTSFKIHRTNAFFLAQNPAFDRAFFSQLIPISQQDHYQWPYHWLDFASMYWALHVHQDKMRQDHVRQEDQVQQDQPNAPIENACKHTCEGKQEGLVPFSLSKDVIAARFGLPPEQKPHRAMRGVEHLMTCYAHVVGWGEG